jgi:hypothetical protein
MARNCNPKLKSAFDYSMLSPEFSRLNRPAKRALIAEGILDCAALSRRTRAEIAALHGIGPSAFSTLEAVLFASGLRFKAD